MSTLYLFSKGLTELPKLPDDLVELYIQENKLTKLPKLPNNLRILYCHQNQLTELPELPRSLEKLYCDNNQLTVLPKLPLSLKRLNCENNNLTVLPTLPDNLEELSCGNNKLTEVPRLPNNLQAIDFSNNQLTVLPKLPNNLSDLFCDNNKLTVLPELPPELDTLECANNQLTTLPILPKKLIRIKYDNNPFIEPFKTFIQKSEDSDDPVKKLRKYLDKHYGISSNNGNPFNTLKKLGEPATYINPFPTYARNIIKQYLPEKPLLYTPSTTVFDPSMVSDIPMKEALSELDEVLLVKTGNVFSLLNKEYVNNGIEDGSLIKYICLKQLGLLVTPKDVYVKNPFVYLKGLRSGNYMVLLNEYEYAIKKYKAIELVDTGIEVPNVAAMRSILTDSEQDVFGNNVHVSSADHCQAGTKQKIYSIVGLTIRQGGGRRYKRKTRKAKKAKRKTRSRK